MPYSTPLRRRTGRSPSRSDAEAALAIGPSDRPGLPGDGLIAYRRPVSALSSRSRSAASRPDATGLEDLGAALTRSHDPRLRRLAPAAFVARAGSRPGWDSRRLALLRAFHFDPSPLVTAAARFTFLSNRRSRSHGPGRTFLWNVGRVKGLADASRVCRGHARHRAVGYGAVINREDVGGRERVVA